MGILSFLGGALKPITGLIDDLHTSDDEKLAAKAVLMRLENDIALEVLGYEKKLVESQASIIVAEATSNSWFTSNWRPVTMLTFVFLIVYSQFTGMEIPPDLWFVIKIGLGGYVGGRTLEKSVVGVTKAMKAKEET